jgi:hypothetical protein
VIALTIDRCRSIARGYYLYAESPRPSPSLF